MRALWIKLHLYTAAFLAPMLLLVATSGGLYLIGIKGSVSSSSVIAVPGTTLDLSSDTLEADVRALLSAAGVTDGFEYIKQSGSTLTTRPTSRVYYEIRPGDGQSGETVQITRNEPDLQKMMIELHKGHGPLLFKDFQKVLAVGLLFIVISGMWLGVSSTGLRKKSLLTSGLGLLIFVALIAFG